MDLTAWFGDNWFNFLQSIGIVGSLWYAGRSFRFDAKTRKVGNLISLIDHHREIWSQLYSRPELARVKKTDPDLRKDPITVEEEIFVTQIILHLRGAFRASKEGVVASLEGTEADVHRFFSNPIPKEIWRRKREFQDFEFVEFMNSVLSVEDQEDRIR